MAKNIMQYEFEIDLLNNVITIFKYDEDYFDFEVNSFWNWVKDNDLNHWCNDYYDASERDNHGQEVGEYSRDEYFDLSHEDLKKDLTKYLMSSKFKKYF